MKKIIGILMVATAAAVAAPNENYWLEPRFDLGAVGDIVVPTGNNDADLYSAIEFKGAYWLNPKVGLGLSFGFGSWTLEEEDIRPPYALPELEDDDSAINIGTIPIGASLYLRPLAGDRFALNLEAGIRYMAVSDNIGVAISGESVEEDDDVTVYIEHDGDADSGWVGLAAADVEIKVSGGFYVALGVGYQFDLTDQEYQLWNGESRDLSLDGVVFRGTLGVRF